MENAVKQRDEVVNVEAWEKPEVKLFEITEETLGLGGAGPDFASEVS